MYWEKSWENFGGKSAFFSKLVLFCQNGKIMEKNTPFEKNADFSQHVPMIFASMGLDH